MSNTNHTQFTENSQQAQYSTHSVPQPLGGVWQDNPAPPRGRAAMSQPVTAKKSARPHQMDTNPPHAPNHSRKRQTVQIAAWVKPSLKAEVHRLAEKEGLSISQTCGALLEEAIRQSIHSQYASLIQPIIEQAIRKQMRAYSNRLAFLLVRSSFVSEQTRSLATNILNHLPGITQGMVHEILNKSSDTAKRNITRRSPQLETVLKEVEHWMQEGGETA